MVKFILRMPFEESMAHKGAQMLDIMLMDSIAVHHSESTG
jgi:hypothetical protein